MISKKLLSMVFHTAYVWSCKRLPLHIFTAFNDKHSNFDSKVDKASYMFIYLYLSQLMSGNFVNVLGHIYHSDITYN